MAPWALPRISELQKEILRLQGENKADEETIAGKKKVLESDPVHDLEDLTKEMQGLQEYNKTARLVVGWRTEIEAWENAKVATTQAQEKVDKLRKEKKEMIANAGIPVEGLSFDDEGLLLNDLPLDPLQINTATIIRTGIQIQAAFDPRLRIIRIPDASLLDEETMKGIEEFMDQEGYQGFFERVGTTEDQKIQIQYTEK